jgi:hypothetical protein
MLMLGVFEVLAECDDVLCEFFWRSVVGGWSYAVLKEYALVVELVVVVVAA